MNYDFTCFRIVPACLHFKYAVNTYHKRATTAVGDFNGHQDGGGDLAAGYHPTATRVPRTLVYRKEHISLERAFLFQLATLTIYMLTPKLPKETVIFYSRLLCVFVFGFYAFIAGSHCNIFVSFGDFSSPLFCRKNKFASGRRNIFMKSPTNKFYPPPSRLSLHLGWVTSPAWWNGFGRWVVGFAAAFGGRGYVGVTASNDKWSRLEGTIMAIAMAVAFTCDVV